MDISRTMIAGMRAAIAANALIAAIRISSPRKIFVGEDADDIGRCLISPLRRSSARADDGVDF